MIEKFVLGFFLVFGANACKSTGEASNTQSEEKPESKLAVHYTVKNLSKLSTKQLTTLIREKGTAIDCIPDGVADGLPGKINGKNIRATNLTKLGLAEALKFIPFNGAEQIAAFIWKGKVFQVDKIDCTKGTGTNRIAGDHHITMTNRVLPRQEYLGEERYHDDSNVDWARDKEEHEFRAAISGSKNKVNLVELNYSRPGDDIGGAGKAVGIRDLMVPIRQDDGSIIFIGRAYSGKWMSPTAHKSEGLLAWFFLDFAADSIITVNKLAEMEDSHLYNLIREKGIYEKCIPISDSVGVPGEIYIDAVDNMNAVKRGFSAVFKVLGRNATEVLAAAFWKGKTFKRSDADCSHGEGSNKIGGQNLITMTNRTISKEDFIADKGRLASEVGEAAFSRALEENQAPVGSQGVNLVELNYSSPDKDFLNLGRDFGIRDVMVPIAQNDGTVIYIGRAYAGDWAADGINFKSKGLLAWFFLDFVKRDDSGMQIQ